jgi:hypothetical protein
LDFVDKDIGNLDPIKPPSTESTPFKLVEEVKDLKELAAKLRGVNEFAVNLTMRFVLCQQVVADILICAFKNILLFLLDLN